METEGSPIDRKTLKDAILDVTRNGASLIDLPLEYASLIKSQPLDRSNRLKAVRMIRDWSNFIKSHGGEDETDPFVIRYNVTNFAETLFCGASEFTDLCEVDISEISENGVSYEDLIRPMLPVEVLHDRHVAVIGGVARLAIKMYAGVDIAAELPINDVDIVVSRKTDIAAKAQDYGVDLTGTKIVDGEISEILPTYITNFDCTMNQIAVHDGKLFFTEQSLTDVKEGNIRLTTRKDPLFGSDALRLPDGDAYILKSGFYRGLSFLFRGKGDRLMVSKENIEAERDNIGRYWLIMLYVKILSMKDVGPKKSAIGHWHETARSMGVTSAENPQAFLSELAIKYPEMKTYANPNSGEGEFDTEAQARWIVGKLVGRAIDEVLGKESVVLPLTYTEANLELSKQINDFDYESFMEATQHAFDD